MSYAYKKLRLAMHYLAQSGLLHERQAKALTDSLALRPKDLPMACRTEFCSLSSRFTPGPETRRNADLGKKIKAFSDQGAHAIVQTLLHLFAIVTRHPPCQTRDINISEGMEGCACHCPSESYSFRLSSDIQGLKK
jgi:hypothetical protein